MGQLQVVGQATVAAAGALRSSSSHCGARIRDRPRAGTVPLRSRLPSSSPSRGAHGARSHQTSACSGPMLQWSGREDSNLRHSAPQKRRTRSQTLAAACKHREMLTTGMRPRPAVRRTWEQIRKILLPKEPPRSESRQVGVQHGALLSVAEVARRLRVCEATVYKLCSRGTLAHIRILNAVRVAPEALASYLGRARRRR
jgi:excisionase family DNA binding protein